MARPTLPPDDYPPFSALPVRYVGMSGGRSLAVHVSGRFTVNQPPLICVSGFVRNMTDFIDFKRHYRAAASIDWPIVLVDLMGRGRSSSRPKAEDYSTVSDAEDLSAVARALGIPRAIFLGQGHGGQVVMALAAQHPALIAAAILINSGPTTNPQGLVRLRSNLQHIAETRGDSGVREVMRQILGPEYPLLGARKLDELAQRTHFIDRKGKPHGLFDSALAEFLQHFSLDDVFEPQWPLYNALATTPLMLIKTGLTDRLRPDTFRGMIERHKSATVLDIPDEGSPALLDSEDTILRIVDFVMRFGPPRRR